MLDGMAARHMKIILCLNCGAEFAAAKGRVFCEKCLNVPPRRFVSDSMMLGASDGSVRSVKPRRQRWLLALIALTLAIVLLGAFAAARLA